VHHAAFGLSKDAAMLDYGIRGVFTCDWSKSQCIAESSTGTESNIFFCGLPNMRKVGLPQMTYKNRYLVLQGELNCNGVVT